MYPPTPCFHWLTNLQKKYSLCIAAIVFICVTHVHTAQANSPNWIIENDGSRGRYHLDAMLGFDYDVDTVVPGIWYGIPVLPGGLVPINDSFEIELGGFVGIGDANYLLPAGGVRWSFHFLTSWDMFLTLKAGYLLVDGDGDKFRLGGSLGGDWYFSERMGLRIETSSFGRRTSFLMLGLVFAL